MSVVEALPTLPRAHIEKKAVCAPPYAGYLHMRLTRGWRGRRAATMAIIGFAIVMFTFFGVTYLLPGLHAYA